MEVEVKGVGKNYKSKRALHNINLQLHHGIYGLVGPNGAGKTTLINILVDILEPTNGQILFDGKNIKDNIDSYLDKLGYLPQYPKFYGDFTGIEFLQYMCVLKDIGKDKQEDKIREVLEICNLTNEANRKIKEFSGGMRQRLGIAQAMINDPELLILDEPTAGLDPKERIRFRNMISNLSMDRIVILATHIMEDVESIANEVILIQNGELLGVKRINEMIDDLYGKVWLKKIRQAELPAYEKQYVISNITHDGEYSNIRLISEYEVEGGKRVTPRLEEVYLYYFHNEEAT